MARRITMKQCKQARGLLKWNQRDLSIRANMKLERIIEFEQGVITLFKSENQNIYDAFDHAGVEFGDKGEVTYVKFKRSSIDSGEEEHLHETVHVEEHTESASLLAQIAGGAYTEFTPEQYAAWLAAYNEEYRRRMMQYCPYPPYV